MYKKNNEQQMWNVHVQSNKRQQRQSWLGTGKYIHNVEGLNMLAGSQPIP